MENGYTNMKSNLDLVADEVNELLRSVVYMRRYSVPVLLNEDLQRLKSFQAALEKVEVGILAARKVLREE